MDIDHTVHRILIEILHSKGMSWPKGKLETFNDTLEKLENILNHILK